MTGETDAGGRGPYAKGVARRRQIIESAIAQFASRGVDGTSLRTLGAAIGVSHATLRHYFASRDALLVEVYRAHEEQGARDGDEGGEAADAGGVAEAAEPVGAVELMALSADRNRTIPGLVRLYATLTTDALQEDHPVPREFIRERFAAVRESLAASIRAGQAAGRIAADIDPVDAAALVIAASDGLQVQWLLAPEEVDVRRSLALLERLLPSA
jgi:AcrR family transcriptional regulator